MKFVFNYLLIGIAFILSLIILLNYIIQFFTYTKSAIDPLSVIKTTPNYEFAIELIDDEEAVCRGIKMAHFSIQEDEKIKKKAIEDLNKILLEGFLTKHPKIKSVFTLLEPLIKRNKYVYGFLFLNGNHPIIKITREEVLKSKNLPITDPNLLNALFPPVINFSMIPSDYCIIITDNEYFKEKKVFEEHINFVIRALKKEQWVFTKYCELCETYEIICERIRNYGFLTEQLKSYLNEKIQSENFLVDLSLSLQMQ
ncbi:hypothetical protein NUSPORA_00840 [Nucleospora cyclopteri]